MLALAGTLGESASAPPARCRPLLKEQQLLLLEQEPACDRESARAGLLLPRSLQVQELTQIGVVLRRSFEYP